MCLQAGDNSRACSEIVASMPALHRKVLGQIVQLLQRIASPENVETNKMTPESIAAVLSPSLVRSPSDNPQQMLANSPAEQVFVRSLIVNLEYALAPTIHKARSHTNILQHQGMPMKGRGNIECW